MNKLTKTIPVGVITLILGAMPPVALADYYREGGSKTTTCFKKVYREEYIPGTSKSNPGRVRSWYERKKVPCEHVRAPKRAPRTHHHHPVWIEPRERGHRHNHKHKHSGGAVHGKVDDNSCIEGSVIGGIAGGAAGGTLATKKNWIWSIPLGVIGGAMVGCQVDGG